METTFQIHWCDWAEASTPVNKDGLNIYFTNGVLPMTVKDWADKAKSGEQFAGKFGIVKCL